MDHKSNPVERTTRQEKEGRPLTRWKKISKDQLAQTEQCSGQMLVALVVAKNGPARSVKNHTHTEQGSEIIVFAVAFRPMSVSSGDLLPLLPSHQPDSSPLDILFPSLKRPTTHR
ncbi:hypothetical protein EVAR_36060_1 [Eumeta japonica]|uniref:Uncharacterized protein n=1 Tax=Eumeta variegata TaxID=151549 RepID=A0A4C1ZER8_EUMVA|nr:hypothetical protein EVAR_36060_1 [Eumeta japonica]